MRRKSIPTIVLALALLTPTRGAAQQALDTVSSRPAGDASAARKPRAQQPNASGATATEPGRAAIFARDAGLGLHTGLHLLEAPRHWSRADWLALPAGALGLATLAGTDQPVQRFFDRSHSRAAGDVLSTIEPLGAQYALGLVVVTYGAGLALDRPALRRAGVESAVSSIVAAGIVAPTVKLLVGRARPRQDQGPFSFHALSGDASFPSGHTTEAFAVASVLAAEAHPLWAKVLIYGLAGGVATARMYHDAHFLSDVVAGGALGTVTGRAVVHGLHGQAQSALAPYAGAAGIGLALRF
jgi:membrane-associated phospholipid phosphatase